MPRTLPPVAPLLTLSDVLGAARRAIGSRSCREVFRAMLGAMFDARYVFLVSSGRAGLTVLLRAYSEFSHRSEVVVPAYVCFTVPSAVARAGLTIVPVDIDPETLDYDRDALSDAVSSSTLAVVAVHPYGFPCGIEETLRLCAERGVPLIEDAAQAMGARIESTMLGTFGDAAILSFGRGKPITTIHGGAVLSNSTSVAAAIRRICDDEMDEHGIGLKYASLAAGCSLAVRPKHYASVRRIRRLEVGVTRFSMDFDIEGMTQFQAALGISGLAGLEAVNKIRRSNGWWMADRLSCLDGVRVLPERNDSYAAYLRLPIIFESEEAAAQCCATLDEMGLGGSMSYPGSIADIEEAKPFMPMSVQPTPGAREVAARLVTLPTHHFVTPRDREAIASVISQCARRSWPAAYVR